MPRKPKFPAKPAAKPAGPRSRKPQPPAESLKRKAAKKPTKRTAKPKAVAHAKRPAKRQPPPRDLDEAQATKQPVGRPPSYSQAFADEIIRRLTDGETLSKICRDEHLPARSTVLLWVVDDVEKFSDRYAKARAIQLDSWGDETIDIADDTTDDFKIETSKDGRPVLKIAPNAIPRASLRIQTRHWLMTRLNADKYGDRMKVAGKLTLGRHEEMLGKLDAMEPA